MSIAITLKDGAVKEGISWESSPMSIALGISKGLAEKTVIAKASIQAALMDCQL